MAFEGFFFDEQIAKYQIQFMAIFKGLQVQTGVREDGAKRLMEVPVTYGSRDRVTAALLAQNTQNTAIKLPTMSAYMTDMDLGTDRMKGTGTSRRFTYLPKGGLFPNDLKTVVQLMPVPYTMTMELAIYTSNMQQQRQILEQILVFFDPILQIQKSDDVFDFTKITMVELKNITFNEEYPAGDKPRIIQTTLSFLVPLWLAVPANLKTEFVNKVFARITMLDMADSFEEYISSIEGDLAPYDLVADSGSLTPVQVGEDCDENSV